MSNSRAEDQKLSVEDSLLEMKIISSEITYFANAEISHDEKQIDTMIIAFASEQEAKAHLDWINSELSTTIVLQIKDDAESKPYFFQLTPAQWQQLHHKIREKVEQKPPVTDFIIKSLRADENCFFFRLYPGHHVTIYKKSCA